MTEAPATCSPSTPIRRLALQGAVNFRDLGGYGTVDGRFIRWGCLFRSDGLADLSEADVRTVGALGLRTILDLRSEEERRTKPNRELADRASQHAIGFMPHRGDELLAGTKAGTISVVEIRTRVREIYRRFVIDQRETFSTLLTLVATEPLPILIHCTSGRDRTGFATAVLLMALGVPRSLIEEDYALSNQYRRDLTFQIGATVTPEVMETLTNAHPDYLAASFEAIDQGWGSVGSYLSAGLGLTTEHRKRLQDRFLAMA